MAAGGVEDDVEETLSCSRDKSRDDGNKGGSHDLRGRRGYGVSRGKTNIRKIKPG
jgi:hypothetical protein